MTTAIQPILHQLFAHLCQACGEANMYYDRPEALACDHCGAHCEAQPVGEPFADEALDA